MLVTNYFGEILQVTDLQAAVDQTKNFVGMSEKLSDDIVFTSKDKKKTANGLVYYKDLLEKLLKLQSNEN